MKIFYDTEFTGLHKDTTLVSIGLISSSNKLFYGELNDYDESQVNDWVKDNVISKLWCNKAKESIEGKDFYHYGNKEEIRTKLLEWLDQFNEIEWVSDVCHYDFMLLIDLLYGDATAVPYKEVCAACHDINQDIAKYYNLSEIKAFDQNREQILGSVPGLSSYLLINDDSKHNSLYDAVIIKAIYDLINSK